MKIIDQYFEIEKGDLDKEDMLRIERAARTCYKSEGDIKEGSAEILLEKLIKSEHTAMLEFADVTVRIITNRGVTHELVRHRIASFAQESTRYCNYSKEQFGHELTFIRPVFWEFCQDKYGKWEQSMARAEKEYFELLEMGAAPQEARDVLPNALKTEICIKTNFREWRHIFKLRNAP